MNVGQIDLSLVLTSKDFENQLNNTVSKSVGKVQKSINKGVDNTVKDATGKVQNAFDPIQNELSYTIQSATNEINSEVSSTFSVMTDELSNSVNVALNDLEQDINDLDIHFNGINYDSLTEGLGTATTSVLNSFEDMENGADHLGDSISDISTQFSQSFDNIPEFLGRTDNAFDDAINGADRLGYALHDLDSSLTTGGRNLERSVDNVGSDLREAVHDVDRAVDGVRDSVQQLDNAVDGIGDSVDGAVDDIADSLNDIEDSVGNVTHSLADAVDGINNSTEGLADNFAGVGETIGDGMNAGGDAVEGLIGKVGKLGKAVATAFAVGQLSEFVMECTEIGSDLAEVSNVVDTVFTSLNDKVVQFSRNATAQYGMSETMAMEYVGTLGSMARAFDFTEQEAYDMATTLTGLTADVSSFYNLDHEEAYTKLKSVFTGETESLKDLGVVMTQTALDQYALAHGFGKTTSQMTEQEKTALRYQFVLDKLKFAQGDFAKTSGEWANQMRIFSLQWETLKGTLGRGFIAILSPVLLMLNKIIARIIDMANIFVEAISKMGSVFRGFSFGGSAKVNTSNVPKLAKGGYVKKNNPQLVMIGDNTQEGEIVAPESKLQNAVSEGIKSVVTKKSEGTNIRGDETKALRNDVRGSKNLADDVKNAVLNENTNFMQNFTSAVTDEKDKSLFKDLAKQDLSDNKDSVNIISDKIVDAIDNKNINQVVDGEQDNGTIINKNNVSLTKVFGESIENPNEIPLHDVLKDNVSISSSDNKETLTNDVEYDKIVDKTTNRVPKLAKGGYVKKNDPRLVMIGDNMTEGEIVAPESKLIDAVKKGIGSTSNNKETKITVNAPKTTTANGSSKSASNKALLSGDEINKLGDNTKEVTNNTNKLSKAIKKVGTTARKVINDSKKALMGFDELNILNIDEETNELDSTLDKIKDPLGGLDKIKDPTSKLDKIKDPIKGLDNALSKIKDPTSGLKGITDSIPKASSSIGDLSKGVSGLGDSLKGLDSDALKGLGADSLAGLDAGLETATQDTGALNGELDQTGGRLDTLNTKAGQLQQMFKQGFELGLGEVNFDDIINHAKGIMASLKIILTDPKLVKAVDNFWNSLVFNVGQILGSLASVGLTAVELLLGGIDLYLAKNKGFIVDFFTSEYEALGDIMDIIGDTFRDVADIFTVFRSDEAKSILAGFIEIFANSFMGILELATKLGRDLLENITKPIRENKDKIKDTLQGLLGVIEPIVTGIADFVTNSMIKINEMYDEHIKPLIDTIGDTLSYLFGLILDNINTYVMPILQDVGQEIKRVFDEYISPVMEQVIDIIGQVADILGMLIEYGFKPMGEFIINTLVPVLGVALAGAFIIVVEALKILFEVLGNLLKILQGVLDFIIGAFTNDWDRAWKGLGTVVEGVFGTIDALTGGMLTKIKNFALQIGDWFGKAYEFMKNAFKGAGDWATKTGKDIENGFKSCMKGVGEWFGKQWEGIKGVFKGAGDWFGKQFGNARETIINQFKGLPEWLNNMWRNTTNSLVKIGGKFGNMISGAIKSAVNYVLALCENKINGFISLFNGILKYVNKLPGVNIGSMQKVSIPRFANGGYVKANTPQLAIVGDNKREGEIIAPESKIAEAVNTGVSLALEKVVNMLQQTQGTQQTGDIVIPVSIGQEHIDTIIVNSQRRQNLRSGGRV